MTTVVYGGTFDPPHVGHTATVQHIKSLGHRVVVVPSAGHEFKPDSRATYEARKVLALVAFGMDMQPLEDGLDVDDPRRGLLVMRKAHALMGGAVMFAIGPDIDPKTWTGYDEIIAEGFSFLVVPEFASGIRSTQIRERWTRGEDCTAYLSEPVLRYLTTLRGL